VENAFLTSTQQQSLSPSPRTMKIAVALTPENTAVLAWCSELTGLPTEELINFFLAEYFEDFNEDDDNNFPEETIGLLKFKDRESAARTLAWVERRVRKGHKGKFPIFESSIDELPDGRFQIDAFKTWSDGECIRVC